MCFFNMIRNSRGSTLMQVMIAGSLLAGLSVYVMRSNQAQNKLQKNVVNKASQSAIARDFSETLLEGSVCLNTFQKAGTLSNNMALAGLYNKKDKLIYEKNSELYGQVISDIKLTDYIASSGRKYQRSMVSVTTSTKKNDQAVGGKSLVHKVPVFLITIDNKVDTCISDETESALDALRRACNDLKGTFNEATAACDNFYGEQGPVLNYVKENFCANGKGENCVHPYANQKCTGVDIRGVNHNNWVLKGFNGGGQMQCVCVPRDCESPALSCEGTDLGTDWCQQECPKGSKTTDECAPPEVACEEWGDWSPGTDGVCSGTALTQTRSCVKGTSDTESRSASGAKNCSTACTTWGSWTPSSDTVCSGKTLTQTRNCTSGNSEAEARTVTGTMSGKDCCSEWGDWTPLANTVCPDKDVNQTRTCKVGGSDKETRVVKGEKKDCGDCTILHPAGWSTSNCHCAEYYAPGPTGAKSTLKNGETRELLGSYCSIMKNGSSLRGTGSITVTCKNGSAIWTNAQCEAGMVR